jgi:hypothetical protein
MAAQPEHQQKSNDPVAAAIERVLKTEREGVEALRRSEADAQHLLTQARAQAAAIARRADQRIARLHTAYLQKVERDIKKLAAAHASSGSTGKTYDAAALKDAARRVAAKLTGGA